MKLNKLKQTIKGKQFVLFNNRNKLLKPIPRSPYFHGDLKYDHTHTIPTFILKFTFPFRQERSIERDIILNRRSS